MRSAALAAITVLAAGCGGDGVASESASGPPARASVLAYVWDGRPLLVRVDAVTLRARSRALDLGNPISRWVRSPEGDRLALGSGDGARLMFVDPRAMRRPRRSISARRVLWPGSPGRGRAACWPP